MPSHQERREPLPKGYQFGDAGKPLDRGFVTFGIRLCPICRRPAEWLQVWNSWCCTACNYTDIT